MLSNSEASYILHFFNSSMIYSTNYLDLFFLVKVSFFSLIQLAIIFLFWFHFLNFGSGQWTAPWFCKCLCQTQSILQNAWECLIPEMKSILTCFVDMLVKKSHVAARCHLTYHILLILLYALCLLVRFGYIPVNEFRLKFYCRFQQRETKTLL